MLGNWLLRVLGQGGQNVKSDKREFTDVGPYPGPGI